MARSRALIPAGWNSMADVATRTGRALSTVYKWKDETRSGYPTLRASKRCGAWAVSDRMLRQFCERWGVELDGEAVAS